jgi:hypothetical protein
LIKTLIRRLALVAALALLGQGRAAAASSATISIDVEIQANLSVSVDYAQSSTYAVAWNTIAGNVKLVSQTTATVTNDSGGLTEKWALSTNAQTLPQTGTDAWSIAASSDSVGADQFAVQAVFGSSATAAGACPAGASADWDESFAPPLTTSPVSYTAQTFADSSLNAGGGGGLLLYNPDQTAGGSNGRMHNGAKRALCWRVITPSSTSTANTQNIQIIVTAVLP